MRLRSYLWIALAVLVGALVVGVLPRARRSAESSGTIAPAAPAVELALVWSGTRLEPETSQVALGRRMRVTLENRDSKPVSIALAGYEDRVRVDDLAPASNQTIEFIADRPGEAFAWTANGGPAGRLVVVGSHLVEGHQ
jgi:hypothetical protein